MCKQRWWLYHTLIQTRDFGINAKHLVERFLFKERSIRLVNKISIFPVEELEFRSQVVLPI
jgi:hypothetical protein